MLLFGASLAHHHHVLLCPAEGQPLRFEVHGRDAYGNACPMPANAISLQTVPDGALTDIRVEPGASVSTAVISSTVLRQGAICSILYGLCYCSVDSMQV